MALTRLVVAALAAYATTPALAVIAYDQDVTSNAIFGSGNANGGFTTDRDASIGLELGLRAKVRYPSPANVFNSNGAGRYFHPAGAPASNPDRANWNFEWSVNTDYNGTSGKSIDDYTYRLSLDFDPGVGVTDTLSWNPINPNLTFIASLTGYAADHSFGNNSTAAGAGAEATSGASYDALLGSSNLVQNSGNMAFFDTPFIPSLFDADATPGSKSFDPNAVGEYTITLEAFDGSLLVGSTSILVSAVPEPTAALFGSLLAGGMGMTIARRRRSQSDES